MSELIHITTNEQGLQVVSARDLHEYLNTETRFDIWIERMLDYGFKENKDFNLIIFEQVQLEGKRKVKRNITDYALTLDCAKSIGMIQRTAKGQEIRDYFIACEKIAINSNAIAKTTEQTLAEAFVLAQNVIAAKDEEIKKLAPKAEYTDVVLRAQNTHNTTDVAKSLGITAQKLNDFLMENNIVFKRDGHYLLYAQYQGKGYEKMLTNVKSTPDGQIRTYLQLVWTEYGRAFINYKYNNMLNRPKSIAVSTVNNRVGAYK